MQESKAKMVEAIAYFEQMLHNIPGDRTSLEFLALAYEKTGQLEKRRDCLVELAKTLLKEKDYEKAQLVAEHLSAFTDHTPSQQIVARVAQATGRVSLARSSGYASGQVVASNGKSPFMPAFQDEARENQALSHAISSIEIEMVWYWQNHQMLPAALGMSIINTLADLPDPQTPKLLSALLLLDRMEPDLTEPIVERMVKEFGMPPLYLDIFEPQGGATAALSRNFITICGTLPFARQDEDLLVAVLNPISGALRQEVVNRAGRDCHFFITLPAKWMAAYEKIKW